MKKEKKELDRFLVMGVFFILFTLIIILKLADLQIVHGEEYNESSQNKIFKERPIKAPRGKILDRNGVPIAINTHGYAVQISKTDITNADLNSMLLTLDGIFESDGDTYLNSFSKYVTLSPKTLVNRTPEAFVKWMVGRDYFGLKADDKKKAASLKTFDEIFKFLRENCFKLDSSYTDEQAYKIMTLKFEILQKKWFYDTGNCITLASSVKEKTVAQLEERHHVFPGITTEIEPMRKYIDAGVASHVIGYIGPIQQQQLSEMQDEGYTANDIIGQAGTEKSAERYLRGRDGQKKVEVDTKGRLTEELDSNPAQPGNDVTLTLDLNLQKVALESLERNIKKIAQDGKNGTGGRNNFGDANAGAVVAIDVNSGEVLAMASYPGFDPAEFLAGTENKEAQKVIAQWLTDNENKPLRNRAIQDIYAPGSTFKPITAIAALEEGVITKDTIVYDPGKVTLGGKEFTCLEYKWGMGAHGALDLKKALETSCNIYFHKIGFDTGIDAIDKWAGYFGLGEKTGFANGEEAGILASKEYKEKKFGESWWKADTAQASIGQLYNAFTPLQLANYIATLANGGKRYTPHIIKRITKYDGSIVNDIKPEFEQVPVKKSTLDAIKEGMVAVTHSVDGTAAETFADFPANIQVAGKTGTAQTGLEATHSSNALFVCYAPANNPQIAVAVVVEKGAWGSNVAPIAKDVLSEYFGLNGNKSTDSSILPEEPVFLH